MKKFAVALTVLGLTLFAACDVLDPPRWGAMEVTVTNADGAPMADVSVAIWDTDQVRRGGETDAAGVWVQQDLRKGNYRVEAGAESKTCHVKAAEMQECILVVRER